MRDASISSLPLTVSKDALLKDLHYFGFENIDETEIKVQSSIEAYVISSNIIAKFVSEEQQKMRNEIHTADRESHCLGAKELCFQLFNECVSKGISCRQQKIGPSKTDDQQQKAFLALSKATHNDDYMECLKKHLGTVGLRICNLKGSVYAVVKFDIETIS